MDHLMEGILNSILAQIFKEWVFIGKSIAPLLVAIPVINSPVAKFNALRINPRSVLDSGFSSRSTFPKVRNQIANSHPITTRFDGDSAVAQ